MQSPSSDVNVWLTSCGERLRATSLFCGNIDPLPLGDKPTIFLVVAGEKPVGSARSGHWVEHSGGRHSEASDAGEIGDLLDSLGLVYSLSGDASAMDAVVASSQRNLDEFMALDAHEPSDHAAVGRLLGYPSTATAAFISGAAMPMDQQRRLIEEAGLSDVDFFRLSQMHYAEELEVMRRWLRVLREYDLLQRQPVAQ